ASASGTATATDLRKSTGPYPAQFPRGGRTLFLLPGGCGRPAFSCPWGGGCAILEASNPNGEGSIMSVVSVREVRIGTGRPKIIVPIFAAHEAEAAARAKALADTAADLAELRLDPLREADGSLPDTDALCRAVGAVRDALPKCLPLLVTMRTAAEG